MADADERLVDITRCSLCKKTSRVPKRLPCFHILCMNCRQTTVATSRTHSDEILSCPVCKTNFSIPAEGLGALQTDSFVQRLTKVNDILELSSGNLLCDACQGDGSTDTAYVVPSADMLCAKCCVRLCKYCCRLHEKSELTRDHTLVNLRNQAISKELLEILTPNNCEKHTKEQLKMYCSDCKCVVCALCYMENHQNHRWCEIELAANQFRAQIQTNARSLTCCRKEVLSKIQLHEKEKSDAIRRTCQVKVLVYGAQLGLKQLVDAHADTLIQQIESLKDSKLSEFKTDHEEFTKELSTLKSCLNYAEELDRKGSPGDVCQVVDDFAKRAVELEKLKECLTSRHVKELQIDFKKSKVEELLTKCGGNLVGKLQVDQQDVKSQDEDEEYWLEDILSKTEKLQLELNKEKLTTHSLKSSIEQLQQNLNEANLIIYRQRQELKSHKRNNSSLQEVIDKQKLELEKEKDTCKWFRSTIEKKNEELSEERSIRDHQNKELFDEVKKTRTLQITINELEEKLHKEIQSNKNLQKIIEKKKQELDTEKVVQISMETKVEKLQKKLKECRLQAREIPQVHTKQIELSVAQEKEKNEWEWGPSARLPEKEKNELEWGAIAKFPEKDIKEQLITDKNKMLEILNEKGKHLEQHLEFTKQKDHSVATMTKEKMPRNEDLVLTHTITSTFAGNKSVMALTILGNELFLIHHHNSSIEIFDSTNLSFKKKFDINGLSNPQDIVSCPKYQCLYIMDLPRIKYIIRLGSTGNLISRWRTGKDGGRLSVTKKSTLLVTFYYTNQLHEYTYDGEMLCKVKFSEDSGIAHPWHAVELNNGHFVVCFGCRTDSENKVCIVDRNGNVLLLFGGKRGSPIGQLNCPLYLAVNNAGNILVADQNNSRLLLLSPELKFIRELVSINATDGTRRLSKFYLNESKGKLFLTHNDWDWNSSPGKVLVFDVDQN